MPAYVLDSLMLLLTSVLVLLNGFFVAAEFALVKVRPVRIEDAVAEGRLFAKTAKWLMDRMEASLSVCQLGITAASLGLGWIGEPALAHLMEPVFSGIGIESETLRHTFAFIIAFSIITALHIVIGEQVPKIYGIKRPERVFLWCAVPLKGFYLMSYPFMVLLNHSANYILRLLGIETGGHHDASHTEDELRNLLKQAHGKGELSRSEFRLLNAVFEFDDMIGRRIMTPYPDVEFIDIEQPLDAILDKVRKSNHTRFPLCRQTLENIIGIVHIKDIFATAPNTAGDLELLARPPEFIPETAPISKLLQLFQKSRQHMAMVVDEYGVVSGVITLENVVEQIVGSIQDEFDAEDPEITEEKPGQFLVSGRTQLSTLNTRLKLNLHSERVDTISGYIAEFTQRVLKTDDKLDMDRIAVEIVEADSARINVLRLKVSQSPDPASPPT